MPESDQRDSSTNSLKPLEPSQDDTRTKPKVTANNIQYIKDSRPWPPSAINELPPENRKEAWDSYNSQIQITQALFEEWTKKKREKLRSSNYISMESAPGAQKPDDDRDVKTEEVLQNVSEPQQINLEQKDDCSEP